MAEVYAFKPADNLLITYGEIDGRSEDPILTDEKRLERAASLVVSHGAALKDVLEVMLAKSDEFLNTSASLEQFVPLRHEMAAFADVWRQFNNYAVEHKKRTDNKAAEKAKAESAAKGEAAPVSEADASKSSV